MPWPWPLQRLQRIRVILSPVQLLPVGEQREQWRRVRQQRKAEVVAIWVVCLVHTDPSAVTDASPQCR